jgi:thymidylate kinase
MGTIIAIMGIDGSGKSSLIKRLPLESRHFYSALSKSRDSKLSGGMQKRKDIRSNKIRWFLGYLIRVVIPNILFILKIKYFSKKLVLYDRFIFDTVVSLNSASKKNILEKIMLLFLNLFPKPNFIIFLSIDPVIAYERTGEFGVEVLRRKQNELRQVLSLERNVHEFEVTNSSESALNLIRELGEEENLT